MIAVPRRRFSEILTDLALRSESRYVIVEGLHDKLLVRSFLRGEPINATIYSVEEIEFQSELAGGGGGNKGRVVRAAARCR